MKTQILTALYAVLLFATNFSYANSSPERVIYQIACGGDKDAVTEGTQYIFTVTNKSLITEFKGFDGYNKVEHEAITHISTSLDRKGNFSALGVSTKGHQPPRQMPDGYVTFFRHYSIFPNWLVRSGAVLHTNPKTHQLDNNNPIWGVDKLKFGNCKTTKDISNQDINKYYEPPQN